MKPGLPDRAKLAELQKILSPETGAWVAGWETLGGALSSLVQRDLNRQLIPICLVLALTLLITFRNVKDLFLSIMLLGGGLGALAATMSVLGIGWNLASLAAIPLLLGTGIDYGIHLLLALKRTDNDIRQVQATTGRAVFFSGMTTVIGFSSLFFAGKISNTLDVSKWDFAPLDEEVVQECVAESVTGIISLDNLMMILQYFKALPPEVIVMDIEPVSSEIGFECSPEITARFAEFEEIVRGQYGQI